MALILNSFRKFSIQNRSHWCAVLKYKSIKKLHLNVDSQIFQISKEVKDALSANYPIVALESTIITHGMPYPQNISTAFEVEDIVRSYNVMPATIGIINGKIHIGLNKQEMELLAKKCNSVMKISKRDLAYVVSQKLSGGTTVSATSMIAQKVGIKIFVTGGIGGVHRDAAHSMDISSDLTQLAHTPITVISAGVKSILDIGRTLEYLETHGVCVVSYGPNKDFPAFFIPKSGHFAPYNVPNSIEAAKLIASRDAMKMESGILIAVPIPDNHSEEGQVIEEAIEKAILLAKKEKVKGKDITPYTLNKVNELTLGKSLKCNIALIKNNAHVGSMIASELNKIQLCPEFNSQNKHQGNVQMSTSGIPKESENIKPVVIGGSVLDFVVMVMHDKIELNGKGHSGKMKLSAGGVGRNIADCLTKLGDNPLFLSAVGKDKNGETVLKHNPNMNTHGIKILPDVPTATFCNILNKKGEYMFGIEDMIVHKFIDAPFIRQYEHFISKAPLVILDGNIPETTIEELLRICQAFSIPGYG